MTTTPATQAPRNYGDSRIVEFDRLAAEWEAQDNSGNAAWWRKKAAQFREHHGQDSHWSTKPEIGEGLT